MHTFDFAQDGVFDVGIECPAVDRISRKGTGLFAEECGGPHLELGGTKN